MLSTAQPYTAPSPTLADDLARSGGTGLRQVAWDPFSARAARSRRPLSALRGRHNTS
jgi:hypothetical protein